MGVCVSCNRLGNTDKVEDFSEDVDSDSGDYVERITHIISDIHERIRKKDKVDTKRK